MQLINTAIVWFRRDLRLADNPALRSALATADQIIPVYIHAPDEEAPWQPGAASRWWLHHSLIALDRQLRAIGSQLTIRTGSSLTELEDIIQRSGASTVHINTLYEPAPHARDQDIQRALAKRGIVLHQYNTTLLFSPEQIRTLSGQPYTVFTPFWRNAASQLQISAPQPAPPSAPTLHNLPSLTIDALQLLPTIPWDAGFHRTWTPGENGGHQRIDDFMDDCIRTYQTDRDRPDRQRTSKLSPHLHFGEVTPRQVIWAASQIAIAEPRAQSGVETFIREIGWREFAGHLLFHFPDTALQPLRPAFENFPWRDGGGADYLAWCRGTTGIPMVDAGMRELWHTGWMHNRVRMIVASFLTKNQLISWRAGAAWFWDTLVDADLASNTLGWQWTAGCGADAAPFFRIFNPVSQGERFDPDERYIRKWCPELAGLPAGAAFAPWKATAQTLEAAGILLDEQYPRPVVDLNQSRLEALEAWQAIRNRI